MEGYIELILDGIKYTFRVEEEESFRKIASNTAFIDFNMEVYKKDDDLDQHIDDMKGGYDDMEASNNDLETYSGMGWLEKL